MLKGMFLVQYGLWPLVWPWGAAGIAASLAVREDIAFKDVNIRLLQQSLNAKGCIYHAK